MRARGLKPLFIELYMKSPDVAPRAGAWIETSIALKIRKYCSASRPVRARGLKLPLRKRIDLYSSVAPRAGAWIETYKI